MKKLLVLLLVIVGCTSAPPVKRPDFIGQNNISFGHHSVIVDKRFDFKNQGHITHFLKDADIKVSYWRYDWRDESVVIFFREVLNPTVYYKPIKWSDYYENVLFYEKEQFAQEGDVYTYRMIRFEKPDIYIVTHFHFVGNQKWLITEYYYPRTMKYRYGDAEGMFNLSNYMIHIRHNKHPNVINTIEDGLEHLNSILFR